MTKPWTFKCKYMLSKIVEKMKTDLKTVCPLLEVIQNPILVFSWQRLLIVRKSYQFLSSAWWQTSWFIMIIMVIFIMIIFTMITMMVVTTKIRLTRAVRCKSSSQKTSSRTGRGLRWNIEIRIFSHSHFFLQILTREESFVDIPVPENTLRVDQGFFEVVQIFLFYFIHNIVCGLTAD